MPPNLNFTLAAKSSNSFFETTFADVAPRADYIGDHINGELHNHSNIAKILLPVTSQNASGLPQATNVTDCFCKYGAKSTAADLAVPQIN